MQLFGKRVLVVGLGRSGSAAAQLCLQQGAHVVGTDSRSGNELPKAVHDLGIELFLGGHEGAPFDRVDLIVVSPGIPPLPIFNDCEQRGTPVIGELELGYAFCNAPILAVGGTNGKSTTTALLACLLQAQGTNTFAGGNLGVPLCEAVGLGYQALVVEVSSFQLERAATFRPQVSVLLNITDDHLDRYKSFNDYARAKGNAFVRQGPDDFAVIPAHDVLCEEQARRGNGKLVRFALDNDASRGEVIDYWVNAGVIHERDSAARFDLSAAALHGRHNGLNAAAAVAAARCFGAQAAAIQAGLQAFQPLPHRMALAGVVAGVAYYDDSKGTNVGAVVTALQGMVEPKVVLIAGGRDKQGSYAPLREALLAKGRAAVLIGEAAEKIASALAGAVPVQHAPTMEEAVQAAAKLAQKGDAVLLSPACSSFDMFTGYAARGDAFVRAVASLQSPETA